MDSLTRTLTTLTGQGWEVKQHGYGQVVLSKPCRNIRAVQSWNIGVIVVSVLPLCVGTRVPFAGAMVLGAVGIAGMTWGMISTVLWRSPILVLTLTRNGDGQWQESKPKLKKG